MKIIKAAAEHADLVGFIHSNAWRSTYQDIFPKEYLITNTVDKRKEEYRNSGYGTETLSQLKNIYLGYKFILFRMRYGKDA